MNNYEREIPFPSYMKEKLDNFVKSSNLDILYENGKIIAIPIVKYLIIPTRFFKLFHQHLCCKIPCVYNILSF